MNEGSHEEGERDLLREDGKRAMVYLPHEGRRESSWGRKAIRVFDNRRGRLIGKDQKIKKIK